MMMKVIQLRRNVSAFYLQCLCLQRMSGVVSRIVKPTYHSSVEWLIADVTDVSTLHQLSVFHAWVIARLTIRYTTPDKRCRDRRYECDGWRFSVINWRRSSTELSWKKLGDDDRRDVANLKKKQKKVESLKCPVTFETTLQRKVSKLFQKFNATSAYNSRLRRSIRYTSLLRPFGPLVPNFPTKLAIRLQPRMAGLTGNFSTVSQLLFRLEQRSILCNFVVKMRRTLICQF